MDKTRLKLMVIPLRNNKIEFHSDNDNREYQTFNTS